MSIDLKKLVDSRIDPTGSVRAIHDVVKGGANIVNQPFKSVSNSNSNLDFVIQTPGLGVYTSRRVNVKVAIPLSFTITTGTTGGDASYVWGVNMGCTAFPFNSLISSATVQINTSSFNTQVQQTLPLIKRLSQTDETQRALSDCASSIGQSAVIYPAFQALPDSVQGTTVTTPVSGFMQSSICSTQYDYYKMGNPACVEFAISGATGVGVTFTPQSVTVPASTTSVVTATLTVYEPLLCQPFLLDDEESAFINTNLMSVRLNLTAPDHPLARILRFAYLDERVDVTALSYNGTIPQADIFCQFITPPATDQIPTKCIYPTTFYNPLVTSFATTAINAGVSDGAFRSSNVITLNTAPDALAIYAIPNMPTSADGSGNTGAYQGGMLEDLCLSIDKVDITWNNNPSLLVTLEKQELWRRSMQNGLPVPWTVYRGRATDPYQSFPIASARAYDPAVNRALAGSPLLLALNKDIPVEPGVGAGVAGVYTLVVKVTLTNQLPFNITGFSLFVVPINSQYLVLNAGATSDVINTVATEAVVAATQQSGTFQAKEVTGSGRGFDSLATASKRAHAPLARALEMLSKSSPTELATAAATYLGGPSMAKRARDFM